MTTQSSHQYLHRAWAIMRILPDTRVYVITCFFHRQDADDHLRVLRRFIPKAVFEIFFNPPLETDD